MREADASVLMDRMYRHQRHFYDLTRKYYLPGRDRLIEGLSPPRGGRVLEVGCGTARNLVLAARAWPAARFFGIDVSSEMLVTARQRVQRGGLSGRIDQGAGINLKPNGDYLTIRANCLENNLVLWKFEKGRRSQVKWIRNTPTASRQWHDLKVRIAGEKVERYLDGKLYLEHTWSEPISGKIGLWSKADSYMHFEDFAAMPSE